MANEQTERTERSEQTEQTERSGRPRRSARSRRPKSPERSESSERPERLDRTARTERPNSPERTELSDRTERPNNPERPERPNSPGSSDRSEQKPAEQSSAKSASRRSRHRGGRSGQPSGDSAARTADRSVRTANSVGNSAGAPSDRSSSRRAGHSGQPSSNTADRKTALRWTWRDYLLQLSVVIAGIVVTFVGSDLISRWSHQRQVRATMQLVVSELEANRAKLEQVCRQLIKERHNMMMFREYGYDIDIIPEDSLAFYNEPHIIGSAVELTIQKDALEALKSSGLTASIADKQVLIEVLGCYNRLEGFAEYLGSYNGMKKDALNHLFVNMDKHKYNSFIIGNPGALHSSWKTVLEDPLCMSFISFSVNFFGDDDFIRRRVTDMDVIISSVKKKYLLE